MVGDETRTRIKGYLEGFIQGMIDEFRKSELDPRDLRPPRIKSTEGDIKPFHEAIIPEGILRIAEFERSFSSKLGTTFAEAGRLIAQQTFPAAEREFVISEQISREAIREIEVILSEADRGLQASYPQLVERVLSKSGERTERRRARADLYLVDKSRNEVFFEIKSPKPNKGQCLEVTERLLRAHALRKTGPPRFKAFYAMAYNPYGVEKDTYNHSFAKRYLDLDNQVFVGKEFWDFLAGDGTYEVVLSIYREVGREKGPDMIDQLALGY